MEVWYARELQQVFAFAQSYFAVQTRKAELIEERLNQIARLDTRERLRASEKATMKISPL